MATARKLRDRLATAAGLAMTEEPTVSVPKADKIETLKDTAAQGMEAIYALYADRNHSAELAAELQQKLNLVQGLNVSLREELTYYKQRCAYLEQAFARLGAYLAHQHDTFQRIANETHVVNTTIGSMPQPLPASNNPELPRVNSIGLPFTEVESERQFDHDGIPYNQASQAPMVSHEDLQTIIREMQEREAADRHSVQ